MKIYAFIISAIVLLQSCGGNKDANVVYEENIDIADGVWNRNHHPTFRFQIDDPSKSYDFFYNVRINRSYRFSNLYVKFFLEDTLGNVMMTREQQMYLFDPKTGAPNQDSQQDAGGSLGDIYQHRFLCISNRQLFNKAGTYQFRVVQSMRDADPLNDVITLGLRIEEAVTVE